MTKTGEDARGQLEGQVLGLGLLGHHEAVAGQDGSQRDTCRYGPRRFRNQYREVVAIGTIIALSSNHYST